jgi:hypothetical protein
VQTREDVAQKLAIVEIIAPCEESAATPVAKRQAAGDTGGRGCNDDAPEDALSRADRVGAHMALTPDDPPRLAERIRTAS